MPSPDRNPKHSFNHDSSQRGKLHIGDHRVRCNYCGNDSQIIWVHGHGQCRVCGTNIDECCRGEHGK